jgi:PAS domain S-box-containing protein
VTDSVNPKTDLVDGKYAFRDLVDLKRLQEVFTNFAHSTGFTTDLVSHPDQQQLTRSGRRSICAEFHKQCPASQAQCDEHNAATASKLAADSRLRVCTCGLGMVDGAAPIIVRGVHVANLFTGQVFLEPPDIERFREQALTFGYDEQSYLEAVREVPVVSETAFRSTSELLRDMTVLLAEQGLANIATREAENLLHAVFDNTLDFIGMLTEDGAIIKANRSSLKFGGVRSEDVIGQPFWETPWWADNAEQRQRVRNAIQRAASGERVAFEASHIMPDGSQRHVDLSITPVKDDAGNVTHLIPEGHDVTGRRRAEQAVAREKALLDRTIESIPGILYLFNHEGKFLRWNNNVEAVSGYSSSEISRMGPMDFIDPRDRELVGERIAEVFETGESAVEARFLTKNGDSIPFVLTGKRITFDGVLCQVGVGIDISERERAEKEKAVLEEQLRQSQKMEALGRLAGGVAHDFNNILTGIIGYGETALRRLERTDPVRADIREILDAGERAAGLTAQLLAFSRKQVISPRVIRPNEILERSQKMLRRIIGEDIELVFRPAPDLTCIEADPAQIDQILVNLAVNARDAMPDGGRLIVETRNETVDEAFCASQVDAQPGEYLMLTVADTGHGMDASVLSNIFDPFYSTKALGKGTGLGLATVFGIVKQNGGFIRVASEPGLGTTFEVYFPSTDEQAEPLPAEEPSELPHGTETILLVEDEPTVRDLGKGILEQFGYTVIDMEDGQKACGHCEANDDAIDLLVTDVIMPGMNGLELHRELLKTRPGLKVLFMSGYTADVIGLDGELEEGMGFLQKPFSLKRLIRNVRAMLDA